MCPFTRLRTCPFLQSDLEQLQRSHTALTEELGRSKAKLSQRSIEMLFQEQQLQAAHQQAEAQAQQAQLHEQAANAARCVWCVMFSSLSCVLYVELCPLAVRRAHAWVPGVSPDDCVRPACNKCSRCHTLNPVNKKTN